VKAWGGEAGMSPWAGRLKEDPTPIRQSDPQRLQTAPDCCSEGLRRGLRDVGHEDLFHPRPSPARGQLNWIITDEPITSICIAPWDCFKVGEGSQKGESLQPNSEETPTCLKQGHSAAAPPAQ